MKQAFINAIEVNEPSRLQNPYQQEEQGSCFKLLLIIFLFSLLFSVSNKDKPSLNEQDVSILSGEEKMLKIDFQYQANLDISLSQSTNSDVNAYLFIDYPPLLNVVSSKNQRIEPIFPKDSSSRVFRKSLNTGSKVDLNWSLGNSTVKHQGVFVPRNLTLLILKGIDSFEAWKLKRWNELKLLSGQIHHQLNSHEGSYSFVSQEEAPYFIILISPKSSDDSGFLEINIESLSYTKPDPTSLTTIPGLKQSCQVNLISTCNFHLSFGSQSYVLLTASYLGNELFSDITSESVPTLEQEFITAKFHLEQNFGAQPHQRYPPAPTKHSAPEDSQESFEQKQKLKRFYLASFGMLVLFFLLFLFAIMGCFRKQVENEVVTVNPQRQMANILADPQNAWLNALFGVHAVQSTVVSLPEWVSDPLPEYTPKDEEELGEEIEMQEVTVNNGEDVPLVVHKKKLNTSRVSNMEKEIQKKIAKLSESSFQANQTIKELLNELQIITNPDRDFENENLKLSEIGKENIILNQLIKQYESTLELVINKLKVQTQLLHKEKLDFQIRLDQALEQEKKKNELLMEENFDLKKKLDSSLNTIRRSIELSSDNDGVTLVVSGLMKENENLRNLLNISHVNDGSFNEISCDMLNSETFIHTT
ncbi:hypothetical protein HK099_006813 [Clydaea vesicula]|uniref:Uncharacterized protein n=1 Tax=Clydaea vesicula TaxID=447962 RepID=A0AAD5U762_9FUNG|nr:hypothetical protein HK099_006813 [Clydaea vesicula]